MADEALLRKLGVKEGQRACVLGAPEGYVARLGQPGEVTLATVGWEPLVDAGWVAVTQVSVDGVWSALRFRPAAEVGT
ncbi:MAG TPA: hypothetical protein VF486_00745 [Actinomycetes bacterium]